MNNPLSNEGRYNLRSGLILYPDQQQAIEKILIDLIQQTPAHFVLVADVTGQVVSTRGEQESANLVALGSLVAGDLAASHEIARLTGQYQDHQMVLREGQTTHTFICEAGHHLALLVQVANETPLGWARVVIRQAVRRLTDITTKASVEGDQRNIASSESSLGQEDLSDLFSEALDDLLLE